MKIKICGLKRVEDIGYANEVKPDYIGFVFAPSKRQISYEQAKNLKLQLNKDILAVGVFVNASIQEIRMCIQDGTIDVVQLHGNETNEYIRRLKTEVNNSKSNNSKLNENIYIPIIKAVTVSNIDDIKKCTSSEADYLLYDSGSGSGRVFNWDFLKESSRPYFLAGGICQENIHQAIEAENLFCIDVSSGAEIDGVKDLEKMKKIVNVVRKNEKLVNVVRK